MKVSVGLRDSKLSKKQLEEVIQAMKIHQIDVILEPIYLKTLGDRHLGVSLRSLDKTDFFTRDIDELQLKGGCRISLHSAKDLPSPIPKNLKLIVLTKGIDRSDVLVFRNNESLKTLKKKARIGSSSKRRDKVIHLLRPDLLCVDIRGTVEKRLEMLLNREIDALVVAKAALIRLRLTHYHHRVLPGKPAPLQGQLAILAREEDEIMEKLFKPLDSRSRKKSQVSLYLGLNPKNYSTKNHLIHFPIIKTIPRNFNEEEIALAFRDLKEYTHLIFTSQVTVSLFFECMAYYGWNRKQIEGKEILVVGKQTAKAVESHGFQVSAIAVDERQEGIIELLALKNLKEAYVFYPSSSLRRPDLAYFLMLLHVRHQCCFLYDTQMKIPKEKANLSNIDEIIFTSPSTVDAFLNLFKTFPKNKKIIAFGLITQKRIDRLRQREFQE